MIRSEQNMYRGGYFRLVLATLVLIVGQLPTQVQALGTIRHAKPGGLKSGTCNTWAKACDLQYALGIAVANDQIWVKAGTYKPGKFRDDTFSLKADVDMYGGFAGWETKLSQRDYKTNVTILSGAIGTASFSDNSYHVVTAIAVGNPRLDGFTITGGNASSNPPYHVGGGIYNESASPVLSHLIIKGNRAPGPSVGAGCGGGMFNGDGAFPYLTHVVFRGNSSAGGCGGGMYNYNGSIPLLSNVSFISNQATDGGGMYTYSGSDASLLNVTFDGNVVTHDGGALYILESSPTITKVTLRGNKANLGHGGGIFEAGASYPVFSQVKFINNKAQYGGGMYDVGTSPHVRETVFQGNSASANGAGIYHSGTSVLLEKVTFSANAASGNGGGLFLISGGATVKNVTFAGNSAANGGGIASEGGTPTLNNVTFGGNSAPGNGKAMYNSASTTAAINNSILWGTGTQLVNSTSTATIVDTIISSGCPSLPDCTNVTSVNPQLEALANNGGFTKTMAIKASGGAYNTGGFYFACEATDQRGVPRPQGVRCDLGAFEKK